MSWRPSDWSPLAGSDPAPGDPDAVDEMASQYKRTADEISQQACRLRSLSGADGWDSEAGEVFAKEAGELSKQLGKVHGRYAEVSRQLRRWAPALRDAQRETLAALHEAQDAESRRQACQHSTLSGVPEPTPEQEDADRRRQRALAEAEDDLAAARRRAKRAVELLDNTAGDVACAIRSASDDDVKDGLWDHVKGFISDHAKLIKEIVIWAGRIGMVLALVAMFFALPGLPLLLIGLAAISAAGSVALAAAGEGSWTDAFIDIGLLAMSVATFGMSNLAKGAVDTARRSVAAAAAQRAAAAHLHSNRFMLKGAKFVARHWRGPIIRGFALRKISGIYRGADTAAEAAETAVKLKALAPAAGIKRLLAFDAELAQFQAQVSRLGIAARSLPGVEADIRIARTAVHRAVKFAQTDFALGSADVVLDEIEYWNEK